MLAEPLKINDILQLTAAHFNKHCIPNPRLEAELLLAFILKCSRIDLYVNYDQPLTEEELTGMRSLIRRRQLNEPLAYIVGEKEFMSLPFVVDKRVLIPRSETEHLIETLLELLPNQKMIGIDVCTGSGAIAISLAYYRPQWQLWALDNCEKALEVAAVNVKKHQMQKRVNLLKGDLMQPLLSQKSQFDFVCANPPYIKASELKKLDPEVKQQPAIALNGGSEGLDYYPLLLEQSQVLLKKGGIVGLEVGQCQGEQVVKMMQNNNFHKPLMIKDLAGIDRCIFARK